MPILWFYVNVSLINKRRKIVVIDIMKQNREQKIHTKKPSNAGL